MAQEHPRHHRSCQEQSRRHQGLSTNAEVFIRECNIQPAFNLRCLGCCLSYLTKERYYTLQRQQQYSERVILSAENPQSKCFVHVKESAGQVGVHKNVALGRPRVRPFCNSRTYQMYSAAPALGVPFAPTVRLESVSIKIVKAQDLSAVYMDFADAVLMETYRNRHRKGSLRGVCLIPQDPQNNHKLMDVSDRE